MRTCRRCGKQHNDKFDTCDECRSYNNANKMIYAMAKAWEVTPEQVREGFRKAISAEDDVKVFQVQGEV